MVNALHGDDYRANSALGDASLLFDWSEKFVDLLAILERDDRVRVKRDAGC